MCCILVPETWTKLLTSLVALLEAGKFHNSPFKLSMLRGAFAVRALFDLMCSAQLKPELENIFAPILPMVFLLKGFSFHCAEPGHKHFFIACHLEREELLWSKNASAEPRLMQGIPSQSPAHMHDCSTPKQKLFMASWVSPMYIRVAKATSSANNFSSQHTAFLLPSSCNCLCALGHHLG